MSHLIYPEGLLALSALVNIISAAIIGRLARQVDRLHHEAEGPPSEIVLTRKEDFEQRAPQLRIGNQIVTRLSARGRGR